MLRNVFSDNVSTFKGKFSTRIAPYCLFLGCPETARTQAFSDKIVAPNCSCPTTYACRATLDAQAHRPTYPILAYLHTWILRVSLKHRLSAMDASGCGRGHIASASEAAELLVEQLHLKQRDRSQLARLANAAAGSVSEVSVRK